ncbi:probable multidrug resistance-associated protein lethal(2)03659 isoform X1 [Nasonia vitripennis]|uniref:Multidrug resistance-associated protein lethal(2)03659 n=1 Tax=Nasonia vitripennis TaxID=7425 RepID=A0A7M7LUD4_NASVI|nr:probable multidrug resistance-associated protein lethal(2)03659 isoform X1 [Nasonia vitripennis]
MNTATAESNPNPQERDNFFSNLFYWWTRHIYKKGYRRALALSDLYDPLELDRASYLGDRLETQWNTQVYKGAKSLNLAKIIFFTFQREFILGAVKQIFELAVMFGFPILLGLLLRCFSDETKTSRETLMWSFFLIVFEFMKTIIGNHKRYSLMHLGGRVRVALSTLIYRKTLRLSKTAIGNTTSGKIVNLLANDITRLDYALVNINLLWTMPFCLVIIGIVLYTRGGWSALAGMLAIFILVPIQVYLTHLSNKYRKQSTQKTDERIQLLEEVISGIKIIKMYAWEKPFCALVATVRNLELGIIANSTYLRDICLTFNIFTSRIAFYCTIVAMVLMGEHLTVQKVFVMLPYYNILAEMVSEYCRALTNMTETKVSLERINGFLMLEEYAPRIFEELNESFKSLENGFTVYDEADEDFAIVMRGRIFNLTEENWAVNLQNLTAKWNLASTDNTLEDIDMKLEKGKLYAVIGMVGSGKSSLFSTFLKEINVVNGNLDVKGSLSYASQDPWVFGNTVRQNILFGSNFDQEKYNRTVDACCLTEDFTTLPDGDETLVGEKGVCLSGGQKSRINLARAVYRDADVYLLDDPLSAVDARVGKRLFEKCIKDYLNNKTRILATHQLQFIKHVDGIVLMNHGRAYFYSDYVELLLDFPEYNSLISTNQKSDTASKGLLTEHLPKQQNGHANGVKDNNPRTFEDAMEKSTETNENMIWKFYNAGTSVFFVTVMIFLFLLIQAFICSNDLFVLIFTDAEQTRFSNSSNTNGANSTGNAFTHNNHGSTRKEDLHPAQYYVNIYTALILSILIVGIIRALTYTTVCQRSSEVLHNRAFNAVVRTSLRFFNTNPSGSILSRFSQDVSIIDELLPRNLFESIQLILVSLGSVLIACIVNPIIVLPTMIVFALYCCMSIIFMKTSKHTKQLEGKTRAPLLTHLNETLNGISTIRVCKAEKILSKEFEKFEDLHTSASYCIHSCRCCYGLIVKLLSHALLTCVTFSFAISKDYFSGGRVGLAITQLFCVSTILCYGSIMSAEAEHQLMAVDRLREYSKLPEEDEKRVDSKKPREIPQKWPSTGFIEFNNMSMWYNKEEDKILKNLKFVIKPSEKVGIVGQTGAGKSSLIAALFRLAELEGAIEIDGIDTGSIPLQTLRSRLSIIPQDPVLFSGTLRRNLDPFDEFSSDAIWSALEQVEMKDTIQLSKAGLEYQVRNRGSNFSVGQRQLICLARAVLRKNRILVSDEATANVDPQTDSLIQRTIRTKFAQCTVITIAHRLNTIMDSDKVMVLDEGCLIEFDHPYNLLRDESSHFAALVRETGTAMHRHLFEIAERAYKVNYIELP